VPKRRAKGPAGWGPLAILVLLSMASLYALFLGRTLAQLSARLAIVAVITAAIYLVWHEAARRSPAFALGTAGESAIVLAVVAGGLIFLSDPIASSVGLTLIPNYQNLQLMGAGSAEFDVASAQLAALFLLIAIVIMVLLLFRLRKK
jgi:hypothetical protein